ncbi:MAG: alginate export family protein [Phycisphaerales bacterium]|nr:alginate export family protein [Phycisphaerales bacterium]MCI0631117.1 alginate export family protein [Phycisphaerales bacterium]
MGNRSDFWDPIKFIPLNDNGDCYLSLGGEARWRFEYYRNYRWDPGAPDQDGYLLQRYLLQADLHLGESVRAFGQLQSSLEEWRAGGPRPTDDNRLDVHQLFGDWRVPIEAHNEDEVILRAGRQEMAYGSQRLISVRESPNIRRAFDAIRVLTRFDDWRVDAFVSQPVEDDPGTFDDGPDDDIYFWGVYATHALPLNEGASIDLYYLGLDRPNAEFVQGTGDEQRHSIGARVFGQRGSFDYNVEGVLQFGTFGVGDILAWTLASDSGYWFNDAALSPRIGLRADIISGDTDAANPNLGTFNPLFPRGSYFGEIALIGPANLFDLHPTIDLHVSDNLKLTLDWDIFWRYSTADGIYDNGGNVLRPADGGARFVGHQPSAQLEWEIDRHTTLNIAYGHFFAGSYIKESGPGADVDFAGVWLVYRF